MVASKKKKKVWNRVEETSHRDTRESTHGGQTNAETNVAQSCSCQPQLNLWQSHARASRLPQSTFRCLDAQAPFHSCRLVVLVHHFSSVTTHSATVFFHIHFFHSKSSDRKNGECSLFRTSAQSLRPFTALAIIGNKQQDPPHSHPQRAQTSMSQHCCLTTPCISWSPYTCSAVRVHRV